MVRCRHCTTVQGFFPTARGIATQSRQSRLPETVRFFAFQLSAVPYRRSRRAMRVARPRMRLHFSSPWPAISVFRQFVGKHNGWDRLRRFTRLRRAHQIDRRRCSGGIRQRLSVFVRDNTLMAQRFDADKLELAGEPLPLAEQVSVLAVRRHPVAALPSHNRACLSIKQGASRNRPSSGSIVMEEVARHPGVNLGVSVTCNCRPTNGTWPSVCSMGQREPGIPGWYGHDPWRADAFDIRTVG